MVRIGDLARHLAQTVSVQTDLVNLPTAADWHREQQTIRSEIQIHLAHIAAVRRTVQRSQLPAGPQRRENGQLVVVAVLLQGRIALVVGGQAELTFFAFQHQQFVRVDQRVGQHRVPAQRGKTRLDIRFAVGDRSIQSVPTLQELGAARIPVAELGDQVFDRQSQRFHAVRQSLLVRRDARIVLLGPLNGLGQPRRRSADGRHMDRGSNGTRQFFRLAVLRRSGERVAHGPRSDRTKYQDYGPAPRTMEHRSTSIPILRVDGEMAFLRAAKPVCRQPETDTTDPPAQNAAILASTIECYTQGRPWTDEGDDNQSDCWSMP